MVPVRLFTPSLSRLWVTLVTGAPRALVGPLVESLRHEMVARDHRRPAASLITITFEQRVSGQHRETPYHVLLSE